MKDSPIPIKVAIEIIQKNLEPNEDRPEDLSAIASKFEIKKSEICSAPKCEIPTVPKARERTIIISVREGILALLLVKEDTFCFKFSIAVVSALSHLLIESLLPIPNNIIAIQILATTMSTSTMAPYFCGLY